MLQRYLLSGWAGLLLVLLLGANASACNYFDQEEENLGTYEIHLPTADGELSGVHRVDLEDVETDGDRIFLFDYEITSRSESEPIDTSLTFRTDHNMPSRHKTVATQVELGTNDNATGEEFLDDFPPAAETLLIRAESTGPVDVRVMITVVPYRD